MDERRCDIIFDIKLRKQYKKNLVPIDKIHHIDWQLFTKLRNSLNQSLNIWSLKHKSVPPVGFSWVKSTACATNGSVSDKVLTNRRLRHWYGWQQYVSTNAITSCGTWWLDFVEAPYRIPQMLLSKSVFVGLLR